MSQNSTLDECKECSLEKSNKENIKSNLKTLSHTRKRLLRQHDGEPLVHNRSVVKISYNIKMTTQKIRSHDDRRSATRICSKFSNYDILYCSHLQEAFTVFQTTVQALHYP